LIKLSFTLKVIEEFPAVDLMQREESDCGTIRWRTWKFTERHHEVKFVGVLERKFKGYDEGIVDKGEDSAFSENMCDFSRSLSDMRFPYSFESIDTLCVLFPDLHDLSETALADDLEQIERIDGQRVVATGLEVDFEMEGARSSCSCVPLVRGVLKCNTR
jgi:hypothetical protein